MSEFEEKEKEKEYWTYQQQRFEAALKFATTSIGEHLGSPTVYDAIEMADELLAKLEETRTKTKTDGDTPF